MNKMAIILRCMMELLKEKPSNRGLSYRLDIIANGQVISSCTTAQFLTKSF